MATWKNFALFLIGSLTVLIFGALHQNRHHLTNIIGTSKEKWSLNNPGFRVAHGLKTLLSKDAGSTGWRSVATETLEQPSDSVAFNTSDWMELGTCGTFTTNGAIYAEWMPRSDPTGRSLTIDKNPFKAINQFEIFYKNTLDSSIRKASNKPPSDSKYVVPNIQHYAWYSDTKKFKKTNIRFHHYLSILSSQKFNKPECVYFWYEDEPTGELWETLKKKIRNLILVRRVGPKSIYGRGVNVPEHRSDVVRLEAIIKYGGIYTDLDVIILKPFTDLRVYDVTMGYESSGKSNTFLCNGIIIAKPNATFLQIWHDKYRSFNDGDWAYHSVQLPAMLAKKYPDLIHTELDTLNRPNYLERSYLYNKGMFWNWSRNYAIHLWFRFHNKEHNPEDIKDINTTMGQLFRYVLYGKKGLIKKDEKVEAFSL